MSEHPAEPAYRDALAQAHQEISAVLLNVRRWDESEREHKAAAALWDGLARDHPNIATYRSKRADVHLSLARLYLRLGGKQHEAEAELRQALEVADRLTREAPDEIVYQESLAGILLIDGNHRENEGDLAGSEAAVERTARSSRNSLGIAPM